MRNPSLRRWLSEPVNNAPLVVWRVAFGTLMLLESWGAIATGWVYRNLVEPEFTFSFIGFESLQVFLGWPMYAWFALMGVAALGVALGYRYRVSAAVLAVLWSGAYFLQKTSYNNHYYLAVLLCWGMAALPAHRRAALDVARTGVRTYTHGRWISVLAKAQLLIVFTYGALAKLYPGWLNGDFIAHSFARKAHYPVLGPLLAQGWFQDFITYGAIAFDGLIIPLLWWRPTRRLAFCGLIAFNLFNSVVFQIGIFPYLVLALTVFFFEPAYIERLFRLQPAGAAASQLTPKPAATPPLSRPVTLALVGYLAVQVMLPLRHHFIPGDVNWREEGHRLSWRMMLRSKGGTVRLEAVNPVSGERERVRPRDFLTQKQASRLAGYPYFLWRFAQYVEAHYRARGWPEVEVYATRSKVYLNGRDAAPLVAPTTDLTAVEWNYWGRNPWVLDHP